MFSIYKKELQSFFYTPFAYVITALFMFLFTYMFNSALGDLERPILQFTFPDIFYNVIFFFIFLIPILTMRTFADERRFGTEVLLMTSPVSVIQIIIGKYLANLTVFLFMMAGSAFFPIFTHLHGTLIMNQLICAYIGFFAWGAMFIAIGMLISSFTENSIIAAVIGHVHRRLLPHRLHHAVPEAPVRTLRICRSAEVRLLLAGLHQALRPRILCLRDNRLPLVELHRYRETPLEKGVS